MSLLRPDAIKQHKLFMQALIQMRDPTSIFVTESVVNILSCYSCVLCSRAIVFGPPGNHKGPLVFMMASILFWGYPMYIFKVSSSLIKENWTKFTLTLACLLLKYTSLNHIAGVFNLPVLLYIAECNVCAHVV